MRVKSLFSEKFGGEKNFIRGCLGTLNNILNLIRAVIEHSVSFFKILTLQTCLQNIFLTCDNHESQRTVTVTVLQQKTLWSFANFWGQKLYSQLKWNCNAWAWNFTLDGPIMVHCQRVSVLSLSSANPQLIVPSPNPFSPLSSSSRSLKFLGTTTPKRCLKTRCLQIFFV